MTPTTSPLNRRLSRSLARLWVFDKPCQETASLDVRRRRCPAIRTPKPGQSAVTIRWAAAYFSRPDRRLHLEKFLVDHRHRVAAFSALFSLRRALARPHSFGIRDRHRTVARRHQCLAQRLE